VRIAVKDYLLELSKNPQAKKIVSSLGLPLPMPEPLERARGPWEAEPLKGRVVAFKRAEGSILGTKVEDALRSAGAELLPSSSEARPYALVYDATGISTPPQLRALYDFFHGGVSQLARSGRVVVIGQPVLPHSAATAATQAAIEGFVRSLGKEIGKRGATAQLVRVAPDATDRVEGVLRFLLSPRSAFVAGQVLEVDSKVAGAQPESWSKQLAGKVAVVTGAARGIGAATAKLLAAEGALVVVVDRPADEVAAKELAKEINGAALGLDVSALDAPEKLISFLQLHYGGVDILVHNAGITRDKTLARMSAEAWEQVIDINLSAIVRITEALLQGTLRDGGRIICLSSIGGIAGNLGQTNYGASKAGVIGFIEALAEQVKSRGIGVNAIAPGFIETRMTAAIPFAIREAGRRMSSLGQGGQPEDVGQAITFLAMPASVGVTGRVLRVCGQSLIGA
jgi:3-oxoacyl-[acyl-carrier protein] reductase